MSMTVARCSPANFPHFAYDGNGGAVFSWYTNSPALQSYAQHILADGTEAFGHNGSLGSTNTSDDQVSPTTSYNPSTQETFLFWTETDSNQVYYGVSGQKFDSGGARQWGDHGLAIVPVGGTDQLAFVAGDRTDWQRRPGLLEQFNSRKHSGRQTRRHGSDRVRAVPRFHIRGDSG